MSQSAKAQLRHQEDSTSNSQDSVNQRFDSDFAVYVQPQIMLVWYDTLQLGHTFHPSRYQCDCLKDPRCTDRPRIGASTRYEPPPPPEISLQAESVDIAN